MKSHSHRTHAHCLKAASALTSHPLPPQLKETERIELCALNPVKMLHEDLRAHLMACTVLTTRLTRTISVCPLPPLWALSSWLSHQGFLSSSALRQKLFSVPLVRRLSRLDPENFMTQLIHFNKEQCLMGNYPSILYPPPFWPSNCLKT